MGATDGQQLAHLVLGQAPVEAQGLAAGRADVFRGRLHVQAHLQGTCRSQLLWAAAQIQARRIGGALRRGPPRVPEAPRPSCLPANTVCCASLVSARPVRARLLSLCRKPWCPARGAGQLRGAPVLGPGGPWAASLRQACHRPVRTRGRCLGGRRHGQVHAQEDQGAKDGDGQHPGHGAALLEQAPPAALSAGVLGARAQGARPPQHQRVHPSPLGHQRQALCMRSGACARTPSLRPGLNSSVRPKAAGLQRVLRR